MVQQIRQADEKEAALSSSYHLPPDPLLGHERGTQINLPLVAYCYLLRRLTVGQHVRFHCSTSDPPPHSALSPVLLSLPRRTADGL